MTVTHDHSTRKDPWSQSTLVVWIPRCGLREIVRSFFVVVLLKWKPCSVSAAVKGCSKYLNPHKWQRLLSCYLCKYCNLGLKGIIFCILINKIGVKKENKPSIFTTFLCRPLAWFLYLLKTYLGWRYWSYSLVGIAISR